MPIATLSPPLLPLELEREIFGLAAHFWPLSIPTLILVAWRVKEWVEPLLYRTIAFHDGDSDGLKGRPTIREDGKAFVAILKSKPASFFRDAVRHVLLASKTPPDVAESVLSVCSGIENLWILIYEDDIHGPLLPLLGHFPLKQLYCDLQNVFGSAPIDFTHNLFSQITHLELLGIPDSDPQFWSGIALIPHLTHLAFNDLGFLHMGPTLLCTCSSLQLLILLSLFKWHGFDDRIAHHPQIEELAQDGRFVLTICSRYFEDWQMGAHTGIDYWSRAEDFVVKRRSGQIDRLQYELPGDESINLP
ncbi:hypothetical protein C8R44DRAFT_774807 [Mycena epipterygia]|nr:hypothetical protein C8R44DRAFT_774807 [Mycena epipterygia]